MCTLINKHILSSKDFMTKRTLGHNLKMTICRVQTVSDIYMIADTLMLSSIRKEEILQYKQ